MKWLGFAALMTGIVLGALAKSPPASGQTLQTCRQGAVALERGQLEEARDTYQEAIAIDSSAPCATTGLNEVTTTMHSEEKLCAQGEQLTKSAEAEKAHQRYVEALELNVESECAAKGLAPPKEGKSSKDTIGEWSDLIPKISLALGTAIVAFFAVSGFVLICIAAVRRLFRASLVVKPFADGALDKGKVGGAVAALVERELSDLARRSEAAGDGYQLDVVVANVELLARDEDLQTAVGGLAEESHLKLVVAVLSMVDRLFGKRSLVAEGELLPEGSGGKGLALALYRHNELRARGVRWAGAPPEPKQGLLKRKARQADDGAGPQPYYDLAVPASSWIQYEAARSLESFVGLMTASPESFGHLALGLASYRAGKVDSARSGYEDALRDDPENVAALVNLGLLRARHHGEYDFGIEKLKQARAILKKRYAGAR